MIRYDKAWEQKKKRKETLTHNWYEKTWKRYSIISIQNILYSISNRIKWIFVSLLKNIKTYKYSNTEIFPLKIEKYFLWLRILKFYLWFIEFQLFAFNLLSIYLHLIIYLFAFINLSAFILQIHFLVPSISWLHLLRIGLTNKQSVPILQTDRLQVIKPYKRETVLK